MTVTDTGANKHLLDAEQMAQFVADGYLRFDGLLSAEVCEQIIEEFDKGAASNVWPEHRGVPANQLPGQPMANLFPGVAVGDALRSPEVAGIITSLVGPDPIYDHHYFHVTPPGFAAQAIHYDAIIDYRLDFDIQVFFFMRDTTPEMGGTRILPGSHLRPTPDLSRMQNAAGQMQTVCPAGTVLVCHHGIWHGGQRNHSNSNRYMFKLRLNPSVLQTRRWDVATLDQPGAHEAVKRALVASHGWEGYGLRHEIVRRTRLWRLISGDDNYDTESWIRRVECAPSGRSL